MQFSVGTGKGARAQGFPPSFKIDLALPQVKLGVECDGESHKNPLARERDQRKTAFLESRGWTILRFWNREILTDTSECVRRIDEVLQSMSTT
ncbi:endonuclease domain-containing protein [Microbacterium sp. No. 7]|uniref:endonuclease domain-containing protein n=1 Tax=Microbacterium sp. No. 7 TaxID=1714373 RepID=UPI0006ED2536|nr:hypothetical protein AOA12_06295 [Microbacterium sp. No. 7]